MEYPPYWFIYCMGWGGICAFRIECFGELFEKEN